MFALDGVTGERDRGHGEITTVQRIEESQKYGLVEMFPLEE